MSYTQTQHVQEPTYTLENTVQDSVHMTAKDSTANLHICTNEHVQEQTRWHTNERRTRTDTHTSQVLYVQGLRILVSHVRYTVVQLVSKHIHTGTTLQSEQMQHTHKRTRTRIETLTHKRTLVTFRTEHIHTGTHKWTNTYTATSNTYKNKCTYTSNEHVFTYRNKQHTITG